MALMGSVGAIAVAAPALATTVSAGGGTWQYEANWNTGQNYSYYLHPSKSHRSSVSNPAQGVVRSSCKSGGVWATAIEKLDTSGGNEAYWSVDACN